MHICTYAHTLSYVYMNMPTRTFYRRIESSAIEKKKRNAYSLSQIHVRVQHDECAQRLFPPFFFFSFLFSFFNRRTMYVYNMANALNDFRIDEARQLSLERYIRNRQPLKPLLWW